MAIGTPSSLGTAISGTTSVSSKVFTTNAAITAGNLAVVAIGWYNGGSSVVAISSVSDGTNTYTAAVTASSSGSTPSSIALYYCKNAAAVASSASITVTWASNVLAQGIIAYQVSGVDKTGPLDKTATYTSPATTTPSVSTGTLSQANEIIFGCAGGYNITSYTESSGFTSLASVFPNSDATTLSYDTVTSTTSVTYAPTTNADLTGPTIALVASFKAAAANTGNFFLFFN